MDLVAQHLDYNGLIVEGYKPFEEKVYQFEIFVRKILNFKFLNFQAINYDLKKENDPERLN